MYNRPLCTKCLHLVDLHTVVLADYPGVIIKHCAVGICRCIISVRKKKEEERKKKGRKQLVQHEYRIKNLIW